MIDYVFTIEGVEEVPGHERLKPTLPPRSLFGFRDGLGIPKLVKRPPSPLQRELAFIVFVVAQSGSCLFLGPRKSSQNRLDSLARVRCRTYSLHN
jgi:hypothetical protein